jgi:hypothetical protein
MKTMRRNSKIDWHTTRWGFQKTAGLLLILVFMGAPVEAQQGSDVEQALQQLQEALENDQSLDPAVRDALSGLVDALKAERNPIDTSTSSPAPTITPEQVGPAVNEYLENRSDKKEDGATPLKDRLNVSGDFRLRHESSVRQDINRDRHRERIRLRVGGTYTINDQLTFGARMITGDPDDPQSSNQTLGNVFDSFDVSLDRAYLAYAPEWSPDTTITAGKYSYPLRRNPVFGQLVWDGDVQPEGITLGHTIDRNGRLEEVRIVASQFFVQERGGARDATAFVVQGSGRVRLAEDLSAELAIGYYRYSDLETDGHPGFSSMDNAGNALIDTDGDMIPDKFASDFEIINPILSLFYGGWKLPLTLSGEYIKNLEAEIDDDEGWGIGAALGKTGDEGDWRFYYQYQVVEQDAVLSAVSQDEFLFSTNFKGHVFGTQYQLTKKIQLHLWALAAERDKPVAVLGQNDQTQWKIRGDVVVRF